MIYADDEEVLQTKANRKLKQIHDWGVANKLMFNAGKTSAILCTHRLKYTQPMVTFNETPIELSNSLKYLGVIIDNKLRFESHGQYLKSKVTKLANSVIRYARNKYGLDDRALELIIKGAILPVITYGCSVFWEAIDRKFFIRPLEQLQRQLGLRLIKGYKTLSTDAVNIVANMVPIDLYLKSRAVQYFVKNQIWNELTDHYFNGSDIDLNLVMRPTDVRSLPHHALRISIGETIETETQNIVVMAVKKTETAVGAAIGVQTGEEFRNIRKYKNRNYCTNFQTELWLIEQAFDVFLVRDTTVSTILVNSRSVLQALKDNQSKHPIISRIQNLWREMMSNGRRIYFKLRQHSDSESFRVMKREAILAASSHRSYSLDLISMNHVKRHIRTVNLNEWEQRWQQSDKGRHVYKFITSVDRRQKIGRHFVTDYYVTQAISGHNSTFSYLKKFYIKDTDMCLACRQKDDTHHRIYDCVLLENERQDFRRNIEGNGYEWPAKEEQLLEQKNFSLFKNFCKIIFNN